MEPHGLTWARMGLHYFIDFMSEASADRGRIVCAKPASPVSMISHMNGLEAQISSIFEDFKERKWSLIVVAVSTAPFSFVENG